MNPSSISVTTSWSTPPLFSMMSENYPGRKYITSKLSHCVRLYINGWHEFIWFSLYLKTGWMAGNVLLLLLILLSNLNLMILASNWSMVFLSMRSSIFLFCFSGSIERRRLGLILFLTSSVWNSRFWKLRLISPYSKWKNK